jgi:hypothetical protein
MPTPNEEVTQLLGEAKLFAHRYYNLTGRPLGITGEIGEFEACRLLSLSPSIVRQEGYDAKEGERRLQIKTRRLRKTSKPHQFIGAITFKQGWEGVLMVILGDDFEATEIWEADRDAIAVLLATPGHAGYRRGQMMTHEFKKIGRQRWPRGQ